MFILTTFSDLVQIPPHELHKRERDEVEDKINEKYSNKVVQNIGLCMAMYDLLKASDGLIGHGTGNVNVNVEFRMIVFRPFKGEIILGKIGSQSPKGIRVSTEFFSDIFVPAHMLFPNSRFDETERLWVWHNDAQDYWFDVGEITRVRVESERWQDQAPTGPAKGNAGGEDAAAEPSVPYSIVASMMEGGMGLLDWW